MFQQEMIKPHEQNLISQYLINMRAAYIFVKVHNIMRHN